MERTLDIAGLQTIVISPDDDPPRLIVVMLHGYAMGPRDLSPFAHSIAVPALFLVPEGPVTANAGSRAWWETDEEARDEAVASGARDLHAEHPAGMAPARERLIAFLDVVRAQWGTAPVALVGFSQGGMLACDTVLRSQPNVAALALLSSSRIAADEWEPLAPRLRGLPVLVSHGRQDTDLAFGAGEALRDLLARGGASVNWVPHEQGHEIPLIVWRQLRKFLAALA
ncbi:MAG: alpha/beta fold hydrolase [Gemmatimonadaceae bacterium]